MRFSIKYMYAMDCIAFVLSYTQQQKKKLE